VTGKTLLLECANRHRSVPLLTKLLPLDRLTAAQALKHNWIQTQVEGADEIERRISVARSSGRHETFRKYLAMKKLKKAALSEIANHLTQEEVGTLGEIFHSIDTDKNGVMSLQELDEAISHGILLFPNLCCNTLYIPLSYIFNRSFLWSPQENFRRHSKTHLLICERN
jgi:hypothetical protein